MRIGMLAVLAASLILAAPADGATTIIVGAPLPHVSPIAPGYIGLSLEYQSAALYAGGSPGTLDPVFEQLVRNLNPGQAPVIRIGGDSTDHTWWPRPSIRSRPGLTYALSAHWMQTIGALARDLDARLMLGINLEANDPRLAGAEADALVAGIGRPRISSLQIGNEPSLYAAYPWYTTHGRAVPGRRGNWSVATYLRQYDAIRRRLPQIPLAGPDLGGGTWMGHLGAIVHAEPQIDEVTFHRYAGNRCGGAPGTPRYPSVPNLLGAADSRGLAATIAPYATLARAERRGFRVDELNTEACGGKPGVSNTFASALWALDTLFAMAREGASGVNVQTYPAASYRLFGFTRAEGQWSAEVAPEYYGLLLFANAAPAGSRLLRVAGRIPAAVRAWAVRGPDGTTRIAVIDDDMARARTVRLDLAGTSSGPRSTATLTRLEAPSPYATAGVTLGGQSFAEPTRTGLPVGPQQSEQLIPTNGSYALTLGPASAALVTVPGG